MFELSFIVYKISGNKKNNVPNKEINMNTDARLFKSSKVPKF